MTPPAAKPSQGQVLAAIRADLGLSQRAFRQLLLDHNLPAKSLSRKRYAEVERDNDRLPAELWRRVTAALLAAGRAPEELAAGTPPEIEAPPDNTPEFRRRQWLTVMESMPASRWWRNMPDLVANLGGAGWVARFQREIRKAGSDPAEHLDQVCRRLRLGGTPAGRGAPDPRDAVLVDGDIAARTRRVPVSEVVLFRLRLHNTGRVPWRDRLLYRLGPPVTSSIPFVPAILPVPNTNPGGNCELVIPCRAQFFPNLAEISLVMVFPDGAPAIPGRLTLYIDTRSGKYDTTLPLSGGFGMAKPAE